MTDTTDGTDRPAPSTDRPVAIVTGSESGIGRATAVALAAHGFDLALCWYADESEAQATAAEAAEQGARTELRYLDVTDLPTLGTAVEDLAGVLGRVDALVNVAGTGTTDEWRRP